MSAYNFVRSGRNLTNFFCLTLKYFFASTPFRFCRYLYWFERYLRSNSKVVVNCTDFCKFFVLKIFKENGVLKLCTCVNIPTQRRVKCQSFVGLHPLTPKLYAFIYCILSQFLTIFLNSCKKTIVSGGECANKTSSFFSVCKNLGAQHPLGAKKLYLR